MGRLSPAGGSHGRGACSVALPGSGGSLCRTPLLAGGLLSSKGRGAHLLPAQGEGDSLVSASRLPPARSRLPFLLWTSGAPQADWAFGDPGGGSLLPKASGDPGAGSLLPKALGIFSVKRSPTNCVSMKPFSELSLS